MATRLTYQFLSLFSQILLDYGITPSNSVLKLQLWIYIHIKQVKRQHSEYKYIFYSLKWLDHSNEGYILTGCTKSGYMGPNHLKLHIDAPKRLHSKILVLADWHLFFKKVLDELKVWVGNNTWISWLAISSVFSSFLVRFVMFLVDLSIYSVLNVFKIQLGMAPV